MRSSESGLSKEERWDAVLQKHRDRFKVGDMVVVDMVEVGPKGRSRRDIYGVIVGQPYQTGAAWVTKVDVLLEGTIRSCRVGYVTKIENNV